MGYKNKTSVLVQLREANADRCPTFGHEVKDWSLPQWGNAVAGEVGELCNVIKKIDRGDFSLKEANKQFLIADEAADIVIYLDLLCQRAGVSLQTALVQKFNETSEKIGSDITIFHY